MRTTLEGWNWRMPGGGEGQAGSLQANPMAMPNLPTDPMAMPNLRTNPTAIPNLHTNLMAMPNIHTNPMVIPNLPTDPMAMPNIHTNPMVIPNLPTSPMAMPNLHTDAMAMPNLPPDHPASPCQPMGCCVPVRRQCCPVGSVTPASQSGDVTGNKNDTREHQAAGGTGVLLAQPTPGTRGLWGEGPGLGPAPSMNWSRAWLV